MSVSGDFKLVKSGKSNALCFVEKDKRHAGALWHGKSPGRDDCRSKCLSNAKCKFFSFWDNANWCQINDVCNHWGSAGSQVISTYERGDGREPRTPLPPCVTFTSRQCIDQHQPLPSRSHHAQGNDSRNQTSHHAQGNHSRRQSNHAQGTDSFR